MTCKNGWTLVSRFQPIPYPLGEDSCNFVRLGTVFPYLGIRGITPVMFSRDQLNPRFSHQPDLNYDNPEVRSAASKILDFWLDLGVDGLRLDAVPYLIEREGTSCENLPETHRILQELRARIDAKYNDRMLLAEANQWPEDAVAYFGKGNECHMAFHFPLMPRMFMALHMEDRYPIGLPMLWNPAQQRQLPRL